MELHGLAISALKKRIWSSSGRKLVCPDRRSALKKIFEEIFFQKIRFPSATCFVKYSTRFLVAILDVVHQKNVGGENV